MMIQMNIEINWLNEDTAEIKEKPPIPQKSHNIDLKEEILFSNKNSNVNSERRSSRSERSEGSIASNKKLKEEILRENHRSPQFNPENDSAEISLGERLPLSDIMNVEEIPVNQFKIQRNQEFDFESLKQENMELSQKFPMREIQVELQILHENLSFLQKKSGFENEEMKNQLNNLKSQNSMMEKKLQSSASTIQSLEVKKEKLENIILELNSKESKEVNETIVSKEKRIKELETSLSESETQCFKLSEKLAQAFEAKNKSKSCMCKGLFKDLALLKDLLSGNCNTNTNEQFVNEVSSEIYGLIKEKFEEFFTEIENLKAKGFESCQRERPGCPSPSLYEKIHNSEAKKDNPPSAIKENKRKNSLSKKPKMPSESEEFIGMEDIDILLRELVPHKEIKKIQKGVYELNGKKYNLKLINGRILARVGGGYIPLKQIATQ